MTRRGFIELGAKTVSVIVLGAGRLFRKISPRCFVRAEQMKYPGKVNEFEAIGGQSKWSG